MFRYDRAGPYWSTGLEHVVTGATRESDSPDPDDCARQRCEHLGFLLNLGITGLRLESHSLRTHNTGGPPPAIDAAS
jgi:hypothetical protein